MKKSVLLLGLLSFLAGGVFADNYDNPNVNSRMASSAEFPSENAFNNDGHSSAPKKKKNAKKTASQAKAAKGSSSAAK